MYQYDLVYQTDLVLQDYCGEMEVELLIQVVVLVINIQEQEHILLH